MRALGWWVLSVALAAVLAVAIGWAASPALAQIEFPTPTPTGPVPTPTPTPMPTMPPRPSLGGDLGGFVAFFVLLIAFSVVLGSGVGPVMAVAVGLLAGLGYSSVWLGWAWVVFVILKKFLGGRA